MQWTGRLQKGYRRHVPVVSGHAGGNAFDARAGEFVAGDDFIAHVIARSERRERRSNPFVKLEVVSSERTPSSQRDNRSHSRCARSLPRLQGLQIGMSLRRGYGEVEVRLPSRVLQDSSQAAARLCFWIFS